MSDKLQGGQLYWTLNGRFGAWASILQLIKEEKIESLDDLYHLGEMQLESIHKKMKEFEPSKLEN
ncbi:MULTISPECIES: hypothetical protein [Bacillus cereus group]|uniref:hypothetical protein n=1 Tax=Bacillus cereus group TaxID=86661 RepID=UPI000B4AEF8B|nr:MULTISPECIES: hypothetical protein [Bacillus cereus group]